VPSWVLFLYLDAAIVVFGYLAAAARLRARRSADQ